MQPGTYPSLARWSVPRFGNLEGTTTHRGKTGNPHNKDYMLERILNINYNYLVFVWLRKDMESFWVLLNCRLRHGKAASSDDCFHMPVNKLWVFRPLIWVNIPLFIPSRVSNMTISITWLQWLSAQLQVQFRILGSLYKALSFPREECLQS